MKKFLAIVGVQFLLLTSAFLSAPLALAETEPEILDSDINDGTTFDVGDILSTEGQEQEYFDETLSGTNSPIIAFILDTINFITQIIGIIAMILIILGGLMMIVSEGDENRLQKGKGILEAAIIGLVISMFSYIIVRFVQSLFYLQGS